MANTTQSNSIFRIVASQASIVKVISYYLGSSAVIKKGNRYTCRCPFHDDHNPSLQIDEKKGTFHCYVDNHQGDSIAFVEQYAKLKPIDALKKVCEICNIPLPNELNKSETFVPTIESQYSKELKALSDLESYYELSLKSKKGEPGREYLKKRGIDDEVIAHFHIGFAPEDSKGTIDSLRNLGHEVNTLQKAGILSNSVSLKDAYENRIMFPIDDRFGHVVAFSGRQIDKSQPGGKYINYRETPLFRKSSVLYHYHQAKDTASKEGFLYLVEGFMDTIAFVRAGINSVVATMGTALTDEHIRMIQKLNVEVRLALDSDEPGQSSMERLLPLLQKSHLQYRIQRTFKKAKDADECLTKYGKEEFLKQVNSLYDPFLFLLGRYIRKGNSLEDSQSLLRFLQGARSYYQALDSLSKEQDLKILSSNSKLSIDSLKDILEGKNKNSSVSENQPQSQNTDIKKEYPYPYSKRKRRIEPDFDPTKSTTGQYDDPKLVEKVQELALDYCKRKHILLPLLDKAKKLNLTQGIDYMERLVKDEAQLIIVMCQSKIACQMFQDSQSTFLVPPFYEFYSQYLTSIYIQNPVKKSLEQEDYDWIISSLTKTEELTDNEVNDSPFDMEDFVVDSVESNLDDDGRTLLIESIGYIRKIVKSLFDKDKFRSGIKQDIDNVRIYGYLKEKENIQWDDMVCISFINFICDIQKSKK